MSHRRQQKNRKKKEREADEQRVRVPSSDICTPIREEYVSEYGYPSVQRLKTDSESFGRQVARDKTGIISTLSESEKAYEEFKRKNKMVS